MEQSFQEVPYYLSANDREQATLEVSNCITEMRRRILQPNAAHGDGIRNAIHGPYGVAKRNKSDPPQLVPPRATSPKVIHTVPSPVGERALKSPTNGAEWIGNDHDKIDFRAAQARFAQQEAELNDQIAGQSTHHTPLPWTSDRAAQQAAEYEKAEAQAFEVANTNNSILGEVPVDGVQSSGDCKGGGSKKKKKR